MFKKVTTQKEISTFNEVCKKSYIQEGYGYDQDDESIITARFIYEIENRAIATIGFKKVVPNEIFDFTNVDEIRNAKNPVEITKFSILEEERGKQILSEMLRLIHKFSMNENIDFLVGMTDKLLYKSLKAFYKIPIETYREEFWYQGGYVIPIGINISKGVSRLKGFHWMKSETVI
jgi:hypothetical protein